MSDEIKATDVNAESSGEIVIEDQVILDYVSSEVMRYEGISRLVGSITESFSKNILGRDSGSQGIKVIRDGNHITVNIHLIVYYGINIPQVSYDLQNSVREVLQNYTGLTVDAVNIGIEGIDKSKQK